MAPRAPKDPRLARAGVSGYNRPRRTPNHPTKSHVVVAKDGDKVKLIRFGQQGVKGAERNRRLRQRKLGGRRIMQGTTRRMRTRTSSRPVTGATAPSGSNPMAQALRELRQQIVKPRKGRGSYSRKDRHDGIR